MAVYCKPEASLKRGIPSNVSLPTASSGQTLSDCDVALLDSRQQFLLIFSRCDLIEIPVSELIEMVGQTPDSFVIPLTPLRRLHGNQTVIGPLILLDEHVKGFEHANRG